jgi:hypothetical protein
MWVSRDLPVLTAVVELYEERLPSSRAVGPGEVVDRTGLARDDVDRAVVALADAHYLGWKPNYGDDRLMTWRITSISGSARRLVGQWPSVDELVSQMVVALNDAAETEQDSIRRSKLKELARGIGSFGKDIITGVVVKLITGSIT